MSKSKTTLSTKDQIRIYKAQIKMLEAQVDACNKVIASLKDTVKRLMI